VKQYLPTEVQDSAKCAPQGIFVIDSLASVLPSGYVESVWMKTQPCLRKRAVICQDSVKEAELIDSHSWTASKSRKMELMRTQELLGTSLYRSTCRAT
jgi:hypothetical protein